MKIRKLWSNSAPGICAECRWFWITNLVSGPLRIFDRGLCRRFPPVIDVRGIEPFANFPQVLGGNHCGEFKRNPNLPRG